MNRRKIAMVSMAAAGLLAACGGSKSADTPAETTANTASGETSSAAKPASNLAGTIKMDGSSTVAPLMKVAAEDFQTANKGVTVTVGTSGTGGGFEKFCNGETDVANASRAMKDTEKEKCAAKGITFTELQVANDGLTVVVNKSNTWAKCLKVSQLKAMWNTDSKISSWKEIDPSFPDEKLVLFGAGTDSGTFDYFTEAINGKAKASRTDYSPSEDDNVTVKGVEGSKGALGYFGLSYFEENASKLAAVEIDGEKGAGCVAPNLENVQAGKYAPLGRPLFIYITGTAGKRPEVKAFVDYYYANSKTIIADALFVPMNAEQETKAKAAVAKFDAA
jgi:phosphate transport system substrate-binding protein